VKRLNKLFALLLIAALFVGIALPTSVFAYLESATVIPNGEYAVSYRYVKDGTTDASAADGFMVKGSGKLIISGERAVFEHEVTKANFATFAYLAARKAGAAKAVITTVNNVETATGTEGYENIVVRDAVNTNNVVVQFEIDDVWKKQDVLMHIDDLENYFGLPVRYNHWYNAQLEINVTDITLPESPGGGNEGPPATEITEELFVQRIAEGYALLEETVEGAYDGTYPVGSKAKLQTKLELAENLIGEDVGNVAILEAAYKIADQAIKAFQTSRITVNKTRLTEWIDTATAWVEGKADAGEREAGKPANISTTPVSDGEYLPVNLEGSGAAAAYKGPITKVKEQITKAQLVVDNDQATQDDVNAMFNTSNSAGNWELFDKQRLAAYDIEIMVLDSLEKDAQISPYSGDMSSHAVMLQQAGPDYYQAFANFAFYDTENELADKSIRTVGADPAIGSFSRWGTNTAVAVKDPILTNTPEFSVLLAGEHSDTIKVYQANVRSTNRTYLQTDELWQGLWKLQYPMELPEVERKTVFISFNKAYLDALQQLINDAQVLLDDAEEGTEEGQHSTYYIDQLEAAIATAQDTVGQLSAPRPEILKAEKALQVVIDTFKAAETKQVHFTAVHSSAAEFSQMNDYFAKPALVVTDDKGSSHITFTITSSSNVTDFKVKIGEEFVAATTVSEDKVNNTRVVTFEVDNLSGFLNAKVRTVVPEQNYDRTHDIRLNFNNVDNQKLYELIKTAASAHKKAVDSGKTGQYHELALTSLSNAISLANEEAVRIPSEQVTTDEAHLRLSNALDTFNKVFNDGENPGTDPGTNPGTNPGTGPVYPANGYYHMNYSILKDGSNATSMADDYVVNPALVRVQGSQRTVMFTVKQSAEIKSFTINGQSEKVVSRNTKNNTRVVSFTLSSLSQSLNGTVRIDWDLFNYHHSYNVQFQFDESSATYVTDANPSVPGSDEDGNVGVDGGKIDDYNGEGTKPEEEVKEQEQKPNEAEEGNNNGAPTVIFSDTASHWAKASIDKAVKLGIVNGFADGSFRPNATVSRGEFAVMISRALKLDGNGDTAALTDFATIPSWAKDHVARVVEVGIIQGYADDTFRPNEQLSRAQLAVMIARAANLKLDANAVLSFADASQVPAWAQKEVAAAVKAGLITGKEHNRFDPNGTATRAEALTLIIRLLEQASLKG